MNRATTQPGAPVIHPAPGAWHDLLQDFARSRGRKPAERARVFREQLGLPTDRPVLLSGHQPGIWHGGILAKALALVAAARSLSAAAAWVVVDHDTGDFATLRVPTRDESGGLVATRWDLLPGHARERIGIETPWSAVEPFDPAPIPEPVRSAPATPAIGAAAQRIFDAVSARCGEPSAALQLAGAALDLAFSGGDAALPTLHATGISRTSLFAQLVARMRESPRGCAQAYNDAVWRFPKERITPLAVHGDRCELPLWRIIPGPNPLRARVFSDQLGETDTGTLVPRALLLTGVLRLAGCDLFLHGTGGGASPIGLGARDPVCKDGDARVGEARESSGGDGGGGCVGYDRVTEWWFRAWLGETLAPSVVVTATLRIETDDPPPSEEDARRARWLAHHARHHPALLGDGDAERERNRLLAKIREAKARGEDPSPYFHAMHRLLDAARAQHAGTLSQLDADAESAQRRLREQGLLEDRTWPFPFTPPQRRAGLAAEIETCFAAQPSKEAAVR